MLIFRIIVLTQFIKSDKPNALFRMYRLLRFVNQVKDDPEGKYEAH
jgi:hypothetical protein